MFCFNRCLQSVLHIYLTLELHSNASSRVTGLCSENAIIKYFGSCFTYATRS